MQIAHNPETGQYLGLQGGEWKPLQVAQNEAGEKMYLGENGWTPLAFPGGESVKTPNDEMSWGDVVKNGAANLGPSMLRAGEDLVSMVTNPKQTGEALWGLTKGIGQKVKRTFTGGTEKGDAEKYADAAADYFAERYGSLEGFKKALAYDPFGVISDASAAFTGVGGALKGTAALSRMAGKAAAVPNRKLLDIARTSQKAGDAMLKVGEWTDPLMGTAKAGKYITSKVAGPGYTLPMRIYQGALKPPTGLGTTGRSAYSTEELQGMLREGIERGIPITTSGEDAAAGAVRTQGQQIEDIIRATDLSGETVDPYLIAQRAMDSDTMKTIRQANIPGDEIKDFENGVMEYLAYHGDDTTLEAAQRGKQATYQRNKAKYKNSATPSKSGTVEAEMELARQQRRAIGEAVDRAQQAGKISLPQAMTIHDLNRTEGNLINLRDNIQRANHRGNNHSWWQVMPAVGMGLATGDLRAALATGIAAPLLSSPGLQSRLAIALDRAGKGLEWAAPGVHAGASIGYGTGRNRRVYDAEEKSGLLKKYDR